MAEEKSGLKWLKYGCFGCLGVIGFFVLLAAALVGMAMLSGHSEKIEEEVLTHEASASPPAPAAGAPGTPLSAGSCAGAPTGEVVLDLSGAEVVVEPAEPGQPLRVVARYDKASYKLEESFEELPDRWIYHLSFNRTRSGVLVYLRQALGGTSPHVQVLLPRDARLDLDLDFSQGGGRIELGGLCLRSGDLKMHQAGLELAIQEPLQGPMERLAIEASMGGMGLKGLGNASPRQLDIDCSMGGMELDLRGQWVEDSAISLKARMGGVQVHLPRDVNIEGVPDRGATGGLREREIPPPTLRFTIDADDSGGVEFDD